MNILLCLLFLFQGILNGQVALISPKTANQLPVFTLPTIDNQDLIRQEKKKGVSKDSHSIPHFAHPFQVNITPESDGVWTTLSNGNVLWQLQLKSAGARSLNLGFSEYILAGNARLNIYNAHNQAFLGAYSALQNDAHKQLFTPIFETDFVRLELEFHPKYKDLIRLRLSQINHGFIDLSEKKLADACHIDVTCDAGDDYPIIDAYRDAIKAVGLITVNGIGFCTGVLVNNTANDFRPYFLTAEHCGINNSNAASIVVYWGFHNSACREVGTEENSGAGDGDLNISNSGAMVRAFYNPSDMTLLEFDDPIPSQADVFFAGWNRTWSGAEQVACIHHPNGQEKRISIDFDSIERSNHFSEPLADGNHWRVEDWELGSTEAGSSGSPLFDTAGRVVGQLHGGNASCAEGGSDWFGAIASSWEGAGFPSGQLQSWLDAADTGVFDLEGIPFEIVNPLSIQVAMTQPLACHGDADAVVQIQAFGGVPPYEYSMDGIVFQASPVFENLSEGEYDFFILDDSGNLSASPTVFIEAPAPLELDATVALNDIFAVVTGGTAPHTYSIDGTSFTSNGIFSVGVEGTYTLFVQDANACMDSVEVQVSWDSLRVDDRILEGIPCAGDTVGAFELVIEGGIPPYGVFLDGIFQPELSFFHQKAGAYDFLILDSVLDTIYYHIELSEPSPLAMALEPYQDQIEVIAAGGTPPYTYSLDNMTYQEANVFEGLSDGFYEVFTMDQNGCLDADTTSIILSGVTILEDDEIRVFPNPVEKEFTIRYENPVEEIVIYDAVGNLIYQQRQFQEKVLPISVKHWNSGLFFVVVHTKKGLLIKKVVKK